MPRVIDFPRQTRATGGDLVPVLAGGTSERTMELRNFFGIKRASASGDLQRTEAGNVLDSALTISLAASVPVMVEYHVTWKVVNSAATGLGWQWSAPWVSDGYRWRSVSQSALTTHNLDDGGGVYGAPSLAFAVPAPLYLNGWVSFDLEAMYTPSSSGDITFLWGACTDVARIGASWMRVTPL